MDLNQLLSEIQEVVEKHQLEYEEHRNGITILISVSEADVDVYNVQSIELTCGCSCSRNGFIDAVGKFVLKLQSIDSTFNSN